MLISANGARIVNGKVLGCIFLTLENANINTGGLFVNADAGFDSKKLEINVLNME